MQSPDGTRLYVSNYRSGTVSVVDTEQRNIVTQLTAGANPRAIALSADGKSLYVSDYLNADTLAFDTVSL